MVPHAEAAAELKVALMANDTAVAQAALMSAEQRRFGGKTGVRVCTAVDTHDALALLRSFANLTEPKDDGGDAVPEWTGVLMSTSWRIDTVCSRFKTRPEQPPPSVRTTFHAERNRAYVVRHGMMSIFRSLMLPAPPFDESRRIMMSLLRECLVLPDAPALLSVLSLPTIVLIFVIVIGVGCWSYTGYWYGRRVMVRWRIMSRLCAIFGC